MRHQGVCALFAHSLSDFVGTLLATGLGTWMDIAHSEADRALSAFAAASRWRQYDCPGSSDVRRPTCVEDGVVTEPTSYTYVIPVLPLVSIVSIVSMVSIVSSGFQVDPLLGSGSTRLVLWYGLGTYDILVLSGWIS